MTAMVGRLDTAEVFNEVNIRLNLNLNSFLIRKTWLLALESMWPVIIFLWWCSVYDLPRHVPVWSGYYFHKYYSQRPLAALAMCTLQAAVVGNYEVFCEILNLWRKWRVVPQFVTFFRDRPAFVTSARFLR